MSCPMTTTLLKRYLNPFVLRTHPDFFSNHPAAKSINAASLQQLYSILNPLLGKHAPLDDLCDPSITTLSFFPKHGIDSPPINHSIANAPRDKSSQAISLHAWSTTLSFLELCDKV